MKFVLVVLNLLILGNINSYAQNSGIVKIENYELQVPILNNKHSNAIAVISIHSDEKKMVDLSLLYDFANTTNLSHLNQIILFKGKAKLELDRIKTEELKAIDSVTISRGQTLFATPSVGLEKGINHFVVGLSIDKKAKLSEKIFVDLKETKINKESIHFNTTRNIEVLKVGTGVRFHQQDNVHTSRIPGIATTNNGTLIAVFDARYESSRDLQGHMDIALHRSEDGGQTWQPMQIALDMKTWGGLPEKFNGVSDAAILVDKNTGAIYIAGLWMYGVIDDKGNWVKDLSDTSTIWNHQWRTKGSQPGFGKKQTSQFLITKSVDDGLTWSKPLNITRQAKKKEWWLFAPGPGNGITMNNGMLVFPSQGRDHTGHPFSNITYSKNGKRWKTSEPAANYGTTEAAVIELSDGSLMLNMRTNSNRNNLSDSNGRTISVTHDYGNTWTEHSTSQNALIEPTCMASLYKHNYTVNGNLKNVLVFSNPHSKSLRNNFTMKLSVDDGNTWPENYWLLLDDMRSRGYSCITSVDENTIGIIYESGSADLVFQTFTLEELKLK